MRSLSLALVLLLSGCAVKNVDSDYSEILLQSNVKSELNLKEEWWKDYNQTYLNELIELGLKNNIDLVKSAVAINKALAQAGVLDANLLPTFSASASAQTSRNIKRNDSWARTYGTGVSLSYELDLWHKLADSADAAMWEANATKFDLAATRLSVINSITDAYFNILYLNESIKFYEISLKNYNELVAIMRYKFELGKEEQLSLSQIQSSVLSLKNKIENAQKSLIEAQKTLRILLNVKPDFDLKFSGLSLSDVKNLGVDLDVPIYVVANRPDLQAAIARIEEGLLNVKASQKEFYPSITIGASLKGSADNIGGATSLKFLDGNIAINLPFLNYSKLKSSLKVSEASFEQAKLNYMATLNEALNEIDTYYKAMQKDEVLLDNYSKQVQNYENISEIYKLKYQYGKSELKDYLEASNNEIDAYVNLLGGKYKLLQDEIQIYKAMAGKFSK
ncbi:MAG: TolC family protein [Campylobacter curvus]